MRRVGAILSIGVLFSKVAVAQTTLGALLDAGAKPIGPDQFRNDVVQRTLVGPLPTGAQLEMMYTANGTIQGVAAGNAAIVTPIAGGSTSPINGEWRTDASDRVCTSLRVTYGSGQPVVLPPRCQYWFQLGSDYYFADSDTDRSAKVLKRTVKR